MASFIKLSNGEYLNLDLVFKIVPYEDTTTGERWSRVYGDTGNGKTMPWIEEKLILQKADDNAV